MSELVVRARQVLPIAFNTLFSKLNKAIIQGNKTRQGYARERILKPAGYFFVRPKSAAHCGLGCAR